jgi:4-hydroxyphenylacetate 3-monooxygenase
MKTGKQHLAGLHDGRVVLIDGARAGDVTQHPAFRRSVASVGRLYDFASAPENRDLMTFATPQGGHANRIWELPRTYAEIVKRRQALEAVAALHAGFLGRAPDHVASCISGMVMGLDVFSAHDAARAKALFEYYTYARDNDLYLTYVIINPQADRSKSASQQRDASLTAGVVDEDAEGITVRGAKMLATGSVMADEVFVTCIQPLAPADDAYALSFAIPLNAKGLSILSRKSYEAAAPSVFDYPLSSRFDEGDSYVVFDNVFVPWEQVFIYRNVELSRDQWFKTPSHAYGNHQAQARYVTKLRFMCGLAQRMNEMTGNIAAPPVQIMMGELAALATVYESMLISHESAAPVRDGVLWPSPVILYAAMALQSELNGRMLEIVRELAGSAFITLPSSVADFESPQTAADIERYMRSASSDARSRVALMRLIWDFLGTEFGSRHAQYEKFYGGASFLVKQNVFRNFDWRRATAMVDRALSLPPPE